MLTKMKSTTIERCRVSILKGMENINMLQRLFAAGVVVVVAKVFQHIFIGIVAFFPLFSV